MRIWLSRPHMSGHEEAEVARAFASGFIAPAGPQLGGFERTLSERMDGRRCVALSSGSAALHVALALAGVGRGDEVWVTSMTFAGGIFPVTHLGATPRLFDLDLDTWSIDMEALSFEMARAAREGRLPKALVPTDLYGGACRIGPLEALCARHGVRLILDAAEALGARDADGRAAGSGGDAAVLSFNGNKIITASAGGMLVTPHADWAERALFLATQAREPAPHYQHEEAGWNYRMSNVCAAIGLGQMRVLDARVARRRAIFARYEAALAPRGVSFMPEADGALHTRWLTAAVFDPAFCGTDRETVRTALAAEGIESRPLWKPMHLQPLYAGAPYVGAGTDARLFRHGLCLPSGSDMTDAEQGEVIGRIAECLDRGHRRPDNRGRTSRRAA